MQANLKHILYKIPEIEFSPLNINHAKKISKPWTDQHVMAA